MDCNILLNDDIDLIKEAVILEGGVKDVTLAI